MGLPSQQVDPAVRIVHRDACCERVRWQRRLSRVPQDVPKILGRSDRRDPLHSLVGGDDPFPDPLALKKKRQQSGSLPLGTHAPVHLSGVRDAQGFPHQSQAIAGLQPHLGGIDLLSRQLQGHQGGLLRFQGLVSVPLVQVNQHQAERNQHQQQRAAGVSQINEIGQQHAGQSRPLDAEAVLKKTELQQVGRHPFAQAPDGRLVGSQPEDQQKQEAHGGR